MIVDVDKLTHTHTHACMCRWQRYCKEETIWKYLNHGLIQNSHEMWEWGTKWDILKLGPQFEYWIVEIPSILLSQFGWILDWVCVCVLICVWHSSMSIQWKLTDERRRRHNNSTTKCDNIVEMECRWLLQLLIKFSKHLNLNTHKCLH